MIELKPCPLCGSLARPCGDFDLFVRCENEDCWLRFHAVAADQWNNRPIENALRAENERLRNTVEVALEFIDQDDIAYARAELTHVIAAAALAEEPDHAE